MTNTEMKRIETISQEITKLNEAIAIEYVQQERNYPEFNLNNQQHVMMTLIVNDQNMKPSEMAQKLNISKSAVSQQLQKLEEKKYIFRYQDDKDKRSSKIGLAEKGLRYKESIETYNQRFSEKCAQHFTYEELNDILNALKKLQKII